MVKSRPREAIELLKKALAQNPEDSEVLNLLGICFLDLGKAVDAEAAFRSSVRLQPDSAPAHSNLGMALRLQNKGGAAVESFRVAAALAPAEETSYLQLFKQLQMLSEWGDAIDTLEKGVQVLPESVILAEALALAYGRQNRGEEAEAIFKRISSNSAPAKNQYASWLQDEGRFEDSIRVLEDSLRLDPLQGSVYRLLTEAKHFTLDGGSLRDSALATFKNSRLPERARMHAAYGLARIYDHDRNYEAATRAYDDANAIAYRTYPVCKTFDPAWAKREPELIAQLYSREFLDEAGSEGSSDPRPIFIVGMIRSGTTLLDQMLSSHPEVVSMGEQTFWNVEADKLHPRWMKAPPNEAELDRLASSYLSAVGVKPEQGRFIDKMPLNYRNLGPICATFPNAKILHIRRDPLDTCLSIYTTFFAGGPNFAYRQENIVAFYRSYLRHMEHWRRVLSADRFFEIEYEELVGRPEESMRGVLEFLGLQWDGACLRPEDHLRQVSTPSRWQARQPIYTTSMRRSRNYLPWLGVLRELA